MLSDPVQRSLAAKKIAEESKPEAAARKEWGDKLLGHRRVDLRFQLHDGQLLMRQLAIAAEELHSIRVAAAKVDGLDRLLLIRSRIQQLGAKINAKQWWNEQ